MKMLQVFTLVLTTKPVGHWGQVKFNFAFPSVLSCWVWRNGHFYLGYCFGRESSSRASGYLCSVRAGEGTAASCREVGEWDGWREQEEDGCNKKRRKDNKEKEWEERRGKDNFPSSPQAPLGMSWFTAKSAGGLSIISARPLNLLSHHRTLRHNPGWGVGAESEMEERLCLFCVYMCPK